MAGAADPDDPAGVHLATGDNNQVDNGSLRESDYARIAM